MNVNIIAHFQEFVFIIGWDSVIITCPNILKMTYVNLKILRNLGNHILSEKLYYVRCSHQAETFAN